MDFRLADKVMLAFGRLISSLSTKLSTDSVDKIEKYFVNRYLAQMCRFHVKCMLQRMIFKQFSGAGGALTRRLPDNSVVCPGVARKTLI